MPAKHKAISYTCEVFVERPRVVSGEIWDFDDNGIAVLVDIYDSDDEDLDDFEELDDLEEEDEEFDDDPFLDDDDDDDDDDDGEDDDDDLNVSDNGLDSNQIIEFIPFTHIAALHVDGGKIAVGEDIEVILRPHRRKIKTVEGRISKSPVPGFISIEDKNGDSHLIAEELIKITAY